MKVVLDWCGRKGVALVVTIIAVILVGVIDLPVEFGWAVVSAFGIFAGANSAITIGKKAAAPPVDK